MALKTRTSLDARPPVGKKKSQDLPPDEGADGAGRPAIGKQVNVRIPPDLMSDLELIAADTGLDISSVIRMILTQNRGEYVRRANERMQGN